MSLKVKCKRQFWIFHYALVFINDGEKRGAASGSKSSFLADILHESEEDLGILKTGKLNSFSDSADVYKFLVFYS